MDNLKQSIDEISTAKINYRKRQASLPFPEKIRILVQLQKRRAPILRAKGITPRIWQIEDIDKNVIA